MAIIFPVIVFIFGLISGSFLNVVIYRYGTGYTVGGRSGCLICGEKLSWFELIPLVSFVIQLGRCRHCRHRISWQYPLVELLTALLFLGAYRRLGGELDILLIAHWIIFSLLVIITVYDCRHKIIPDHFVYTFIALALLQAVWRGEPASAVVVGLIFFAGFWLLWFASRGRWLGFGDAKLALGLGLFLGAPAAWSALVLAFWLGALVGLGLVAWRSHNLKSEVPFAPFLIAGAVLVYLFQFDVFNLMSFL